MCILYASKRSGSNKLMAFTKEMLNLNIYSWFKYQWIVGYDVSGKYIATDASTDRLDTQGTEVL